MQVEDSLLLNSTSKVTGTGTITTEGKMFKTVGTLNEQKLQAAVATLECWCAHLINLKVAKENRSKLLAVLIVTES
jgi:hypothetical protein